MGVPRVRRVGPASSHFCFKSSVLRGQENSILSIAIANISAKNLFGEWLAPLRQFANRFARFAALAFDERPQTKIAPQRFSRRRKRNACYYRVNFEHREANVLCSRCSTNLPDGSQFCLECGQRVDLAANSIALATIPAQFPCGKCGTSLPPAAEFCPKCGQPVISTTNSGALAPVPASRLARA